MIVKDSSPVALNLICFTRVEDVTALAYCTALQHLNLSFCSKVEDIADLASSISLPVFNLSWCLKVKKISALDLLDSCTNLKTLMLEGLQPRGYDEDPLRMMIRWWGFP